MNARNSPHASETSDLNDLLEIESIDGKPHAAGTVPGFGDDENDFGIQSDGSFVSHNDEDEGNMINEISSLPGEPVGSSEKKGSPNKQVIAAPLPSQSVSAPSNTKAWMQGRNETSKPAPARFNPNRENSIIDLIDDDGGGAVPRQPSKKQRTGIGTIQSVHKPPWAAINGAKIVLPGGVVRSRTDIRPGAALQNSSIGSVKLPNGPLSSQSFSSRPPMDKPMYFNPPGFAPTWEYILPRNPTRPITSSPSGPGTTRRRAFQLSLLNVKEFTITGLPVTFEGIPTPIGGLRAAIKSISRDHGKAVFHKDVDGGGRWRIPLGAYHAFAAYLQAQPLTTVHGISQQQLQVATVERARQEKGYPTAEDLVAKGLPSKLAKTLAPFQRGGVDFVLSRGGRALVADDMGLGKTIQGVASMAIYRSEWPLLVLSPSSARFHWENEFVQWLGNENDEKTISRDEDCLSRNQINTLMSSKDELLPSPSTKIVICSYGLVSTLVENGRLQPGIFKCAIVDESHMLKNKSSKRTSTLIPILSATKRCVLLSGTPAFARPSELWPQLLILGTEKEGWWNNEAEFVHKYVKTANRQTRAELHAMLTGTVMIRRLKNDILHELPKKLREKAAVNILDDWHRNEFKVLLAALREGEGTLGKLARLEHDRELSDLAHGRRSLRDAMTNDAEGLVTQDNGREMQESIQALQARIKKHHANSMAQIEKQVHGVPAERREGLKARYAADLTSRLEDEYIKGVRDIRTGFRDNTERRETKRTSVLSQLFELTGKVKIPVIVDLVKRWINDPTKGKLCIFAHHLSVLDAIQRQADLSNFIRIDGATNPKFRQEQIKQFQSNPSTRIALLGITAAGVAVTLTASSTVWFAELFWTPALLIQAEDRCHRIGQQAQVRCMYFVARGTIDDILWRLIEKKFTDLGEFVEGKEKHKLVVDKTYHSLKEIQSQFQGIHIDPQDEDAIDMDGINEDLFLDSDLVHDIELLGNEECRKVTNVDGDEPPQPEATRQGAADSFKKKQPSSEKLGSTEEDAIPLSDDEDDARIKPPSTKNTQLPSRPTLSNSCRLYRIIMQGPNLGLSVENHYGRLLVSRVEQSRLQRLGRNSKPAVGDILVGMNGVRIDLTHNVTGLLMRLKEAVHRGTVEFIFAEDADFASTWRPRTPHARPPPSQQPPPANRGEVEVIEID